MTNKEKSKSTEMAVEDSLVYRFMDGVPVDIPKVFTIAYLFVSALVCLNFAYGQGEESKYGVDKAVKYAISPTSEEIGNKHIKNSFENLLNKIDNRRYGKSIWSEFSKEYDEEEDKKLAVQKSISEVYPIKFITLENGKTYWTSDESNQEFDISYAKGIRGKLNGEPIFMSWEKLNENISYVEFDLNKNIAKVERKDGKTFILEDAEISTEGENNGSWWIEYIYESPIAGGKQDVIIAGDIEEYGDEIKRIVFGLSRPKMNPKNKKVYPPSYTYDPFDGTTLVPVEWEGNIHESK